MEQLQKTMQFTNEKEKDIKSENGITISKTEVRFDILAVLRKHGKWDVSHLENVFYPFDGD